ncbi:RNA pseudouridylate synthase domain-containing protein [Ditylenchus destructor]|nr:RNA pseudouridylate synthase domain-containing protein [Ditylenchus destructor]
MRLDRWFKVSFPGLGFGHLQKLLRSGQVRVDGGRVKADTRLQAGQSVRIPPLGVDEKATGPVTARTIRSQEDGDVLKQMLIYEDAKVFVFNKPAGLAVQGGSGLVRHVDGCLVVAKTRGAAQALTAAFRERDTKKTYWALVKGVPRKREDKISTWLVKEQTPDGDKMRVCQHGEPDFDHAVSYYRIIEKVGNNLTWLEMEPYTGRTHQLRVHAAHIGHPIIGDPKYFEADQNWELPGGIQKNCIFTPAAFASQIHRVALLMSPHRCHRIWCSRGTCLALMRQTRKSKDVGYGGRIGSGPGVVRRAGNCPRHVHHVHLGA